MDFIRATFDKATGIRESVCVSAIRSQFIMRGFLEGRERFGTSGNISYIPVKYFWFPPAFLLFKDFFLIRFRLIYGLENVKRDHAGFSKAPHSHNRGVICMKNVKHKIQICCHSVLHFCSLPELFFSDLKRG